MRGKYKNDFNTKKNLSNSLKELMKTKPLSKITINDITANIHVNRNTFYYHFNDMIDLIRWTIEYDTKDVKKRFDITNHLEAFESILNYIDQHKIFLKKIEHSFNETQLKNLFFHEFFDAIEYLIETEEIKKNIQIDSEYKAFLCTFLTNAIGSTLIDYYLNNKNHTKQEIIHYYSITIQSIIQNITNY